MNFRKLKEEAVARTVWRTLWKGLRTCRDTDLERNEYVCKTWSLMLLANHRLRAFENMLPRKVSGAKWEEI